MIERITGSEKAVPDPQGDYLIKTEGAGFFARVDGEEPPVIRVFSVVAAKVDKTPELFEALNSINTQLVFARTMWVEGQILFEGESLAMSTEDADFAQICRTIAMASDRFGPQLLQQFGGKPFFEETKATGYKAPEPDQPGYL